MVKDILQNTIAESGNRLFGGKESFGGFLLCAVGIDKSEEIFRAETVGHDLRLASRCQVIIGEHSVGSVLVIAHQSAVHSHGGNEATFVLEGDEQLMFGG